MWYRRDQPVVERLEGFRITSNQSPAVGLPNGCIPRNRAVSRLSPRVTDHDTPQESPDAQRKRIEALVQDPAMQQVAATARARGPERSPQPSNPDKQRMQRRLATMAAAAERDPEFEHRIKNREQVRNGEPRHASHEAEADRQQGLPVSAQWDNRQHVNLPAPLTETRHITPTRKLRNGKASLPFDFAVVDDQPRFEVGWLPTLAPDPSKLVPSTLLELWNPVPSRGRHGPTPVLCRLGWAPLLHVPPDARANDAVSLRIRLGALAAYVWPDTVKVRDDGRVRGYKPATHGPLLWQALRDLNDPDRGAIAWADGDETGRRILVVVNIYPDTLHADGTVGFVVSLPPGAKRRGPQVDPMLLARQAARSDRRRRALITGYCLWDAYGTVRGRLINPTVPAKVRTDAAGYAISATGRVLLDRHGRPTRSATHPKAVQIGRGRAQRRDLERYYPWLLGNDLILVCHPRTADTPARRRDQRRYTLKTLTEMQAIGVLDFETRYASTRGGRELVAVRLLPSTEHLTTHAARWAANHHAT